MTIPQSRSSLTRFAWLSIAAAVVTIGLKAGAYLVTGSIGLLSDALESVVNLVAAIVALVVLTVVARPPDEDHAYGHDKAEYFSSGVEGALILVAAASIAYAATGRLYDPRSIEHAGLGLVISVGASAINFVVARVLMKAGHHYHSITLEADAHHLMTDVRTAVGVVIGVALVAIPDWEILDPIIALIVAANIVWTGVRILRQSALGLLDTALPAVESQQVIAVLARYVASEGVQYHALRTRQAAARRFVSVHILVPGSWTVQHGHKLLDRIEQDVCIALPNTTIFTHLEPIEDPASFADQDLDRVGQP